MEKSLRFYQRKVGCVDLFALKCLCCGLLYTGRGVDHKSNKNETGDEKLHSSRSGSLYLDQIRLLFRRKLSEYHTGYRAFARKVLLAIPFELNDNDFVFDAQILAQLVACRFRIGEVSCPTKYFPEASSIGLASGIRYAWGCVIVAMQYALHVRGVTRFKYLEPRDAGK